MGFLQRKVKPRAFIFLHINPTFFAVALDNPARLDRPGAYFFADSGLQLIAYSC